MDVLSRTPSLTSEQCSRIEHSYNKAMAAMLMLGGEGSIRSRLFDAWLVELMHLHPDALASGAARDFEFLKSHVSLAIEVGGDGHLRLANTFTDVEVTLACDAVRRICIACFTAHNRMLETRAPAPALDCCELPSAWELLQSSLDSSAFDVCSVLADMDRERLASWTPDTLAS